MELGILSLSDLQTSLDTGQKVTAGQRLADTVDYAPGSALVMRHSQVALRHRGDPSGRKATAAGARSPRWASDK
jgi:hypothetical protein